MYHTIKTLLSQGRSERSISRELGVSRRVVQRVKKEVRAGAPPGKYKRSGVLTEYEEEIKQWMGQDLSSVLIRQKLCSKYGLTVSYPTVRRKVRQLKGIGEVYVPVHSEPGEEAQVDFGYVGRFMRNGQAVKCWVFSMQLSHSRYAYYEVVTDQSIPSFLGCHQNGFEYFSGVSQTVKLDNLKAGVIKADFYEPLIQDQYAAFLSHYGSAPITARVRRPQDKGKVESGIKYVKNNFFKGLEHNDWDRMLIELAEWNREVCNKRTHGTTRKVPATVFTQVERLALLPLPSCRFEIYRIEERKVNRLSHINFDCSYYSVPHTYVGQVLRIESNGRILKVYHHQTEVALHQLADTKGVYVSLDEHRPPGKRSKDPEYYQQQLREIGPHAQSFMEVLRRERSRHWRDKIRGILSLRKIYAPALIELACKRALDYQAHTYQTVRNICQKGLVEPKDEASFPHGMGGFNHELSKYDHLTQ